MADEVQVEVGKFTVGEGSDPSSVMSSIRQALEGAFDGTASEPRSRRDKVDHDTALGILAEVFARYTRSYGVNQADGCPYKPGEVITPQSSAALSNVGDPHIVLESRLAPPDFVNHEGGPSSNSFGGRRDIRVACVVLGSRTGRPGAVVHWVESFEFVPYEPK